MYESDYAHTKSVHETLFLLFCSERGFMPATPPGTQYNVFTDAFSRLQNEIITNLRGGTEDFNLALTLAGLPRTEVALNYRKDAELFKRVYGPWNLFPEDTVIVDHVFPCIGWMIERAPVMKDVVVRALQEHEKQFGKAVGDRNRGYLRKFGLDSLLPLVTA